MSKKLPDYLVLYVDPGETTGWCVGRGPLLVAAGQTPLWEFADRVYESLCAGRNICSLVEDIHVRENMDEHLDLPVREIVCEDWRLYPDKLRALGWDQCRTARLIGALTAFARIFGLKWVLQPAAIKQEAQRLGAEQFYYSPRHENRHQNDAIQHFCYYTAFGPDGSGTTPNNVSNKERDSS